MMLADIRSAPRAALSAATPPPLELVHVSCCVCDSDDATPIAVGEDFEYRTSQDSFLAMRCKRCGLIYLNPRPAVDELARIYPSNYHAFEFTPERFGFVYGVRRRLEAMRVLGYCRGVPIAARIIDVGCGDGFHLKLLADYGPSSYTLEGIDPDARAVEAANRSGLTVHHGTIESLDLKPGRYDLALLIQTIEHVSDPPALLRGIRRILRPGGKLVIVTDNTDSLDRKLFEGRHWGGYHFPRHWNLFNSTSLRRLASRTGLSVERMTTIVSPVNWVYSVRNALVDYGAAHWLCEQFSLSSAGSLGLFTLVNSLERVLGNGALLCATLSRPASTS
jgi:SAM-dependent methyltransferase